MSTILKIKRPVQTSRLTKSNLVIARTFTVSAQASPENKEQFTKRALKQPSMEMQNPCRKPYTLKGDTTVR